MRWWLVIGGDWWWLMGGLGTTSYLHGSLTTARPGSFPIGALRQLFRGKLLNFGGGTLPESNKKATENRPCKRKFIDSNHWFSGDMFVLGRVLCCCFLGPDILFLLGKPEMIVDCFKECRLWSMPKINSWNLKMMVWDDDFPLPGVYPQVSC